MTERSDTPLVSVRGEATIEADPEIAKLVVVVAARDRDRRRALDRLAERNTACLELIRGYGETVENVAGGRLTVVPELRDGRGERVKSYRDSYGSTSPSPTSPYSASWSPACPTRS